MDVRRTRATTRRPTATGRRDASFIEDQRLRAIVLRMISTNSLGAFAQEITRRPPVEPVRNATSASPSAGAGASQPTLEAAPVQRPLDSVPAAPGRLMPRGSILDIRV